MDIQHLRYFVAVVKYGSFSKAAKELFITQQGISKAIARLESELHAPLFIRGRSVKLSEAGKKIYDDAVQILVHDDNIHEALRRTEKQTIPLRVAYADGILCNLRPDFFSLFLQEHPEIDLETLNCNDYGSERLVQQRRADLAFCTEPYNENIFVPMLSMKIPIRAVISAKHPLAAKKALHMADLRGEKLIALDENTKHNAVFMKTFAEFGLTPRLFIKPQEFQLQFDLCRAGRGIGFYSGCTAYVPEGVELRRIADLPITSCFVLLRARDVPPTREMTLFAQAIRVELQRSA